MREQRLLGLNGDEAAAYAIKQVNPDVVAAYPITPQTIIVERFSEYVADGLVDTEFVAVESEHSAMSCCIGAAAAGARAFTATAANGLALMWEMLYIAASLRLPIVMAVVNRALSAPINIHNDHSDSMGARDSGWIQIYCENSQEVYDACVEAWRIGEHLDVQLPVMVCLDGFTLSHTMENVQTLSDEAVREFVGERPYIKVQGHLGEAEFRLDPENPLTMGPLDLYDFYFEHKMHQVEAMEKALKAMPQVDEEYAELSGRGYQLLHPYEMEDAEVALIGLGSTMGTVRYVVDRLRRRGVKAGMMKMRVFRPFPAEQLIELLKDVEVVGVLDKAMSFGAPGGPLYEELRTIFYDAGRQPLIVDYVYGLGGRDTPPRLIEEAFEGLMEAKRRGEVVERLNFLGVRW
ncbi:MAG: 2-ketoisovalerate ferredoxin oxidoreductase subunit alpha [Candidatus Bathyarchaeota archaeon B23]|nr:MAG: 2-ketoisovalerate ferredoxin oxidoreductase subunit alpha [Candidatus Bathyarchaeota archaeon B23]